MGSNLLLSGRVTGRHKKKEAKHGKKEKCGRGKERKEGITALPCKSSIHKWAISFFTFPGKQKDPEAWETHEEINHSPQDIVKRTGDGN